LRAPGPSPMVGAKRNLRRITVIPCDTRRAC
jgi:hypothetical protein